MTTEAVPSRGVQRTLRRRALAGALLLLSLAPLMACEESPPCPGLPETIPSDWGTIPEGLDTAAWDAAITEQMREGCIPALSVAVVDGDRELLSAAWGYADVDAGIPATVETPFMLASVSKAVDALAILAARDEGLLELDDPISELVDLPIRNLRINLGDAPPIRLHHLATHSSGIQDNWDVLDATYKPGDPEEALGSFLADYLLADGRHFSRRKNFYAWPAGREWFYSNVGAALAAYGVEVRAGVPYDVFCRSRIFEPLGLEHTGWFLRDFDDPTAIARPHSITAEGWDVQEHYGYSTWPDGQLRTTASELGKILRVSLGDGMVDGVRLLSPGVREVLSTPPVDGLDDWYIRPYVEAQYFFWFGMTLGDRWLIGHDGDDFGVSTEMFYDAGTNIGVVLLANIGDGENEGRVREQTMAIQERLYAFGEGR